MRTGTYYYARQDWDQDAWVKVISIEYESLVTGFPFDKVLGDLSRGRRLRLLDVGCGSAIFPRYLEPVLSPGIRFAADLLDVSSASLRQASQVLGNLERYEVGRRHETLIEDLPTALAAQGSAYDVIWAIHSLTTVDLQRIARAIRHLNRMLAPKGLLLIYQLAHDSSYQKLHAHYRAHHANGKTVSRYMESEDTQGILESLGVSLTIHPFRFEHRIDGERTDLLEKYLRKVILDDSVAPIELFDRILSEFYDASRRQFRFPQHVDLIVVPQDPSPTLSHV